MKSRFLVLAALFALPMTAAAQSYEELRAMTPEDRRQYIESMSDDERKAMREQWRAEFDALPEEEKQAIREERKARAKERRAAARARMAEMTPEEREAAREKHRAMREERGDKPRRRHHERKKGDPAEAADSIEQ